MGHHYEIFNDFGANTNQRSTNKRIIKPNSKNIASKHFPNDFFNKKMVS